MKMFKQLISNHDGSAILTMLIALVIAAGAAVTLMSKSENEAKLYQGSNMKTALNRLDQRFRANLSQYDFCTTNLYGKKIGDEIDTPMKRDAVETILEKGMVFKMAEGDIKIVSIKLKRFLNKDLGLDADHVSVSFELDPLNKKDMIQSREVAKNYLIKSHKDASENILGCYHELSNLVDKTVSENCNELFNGTTSENGFKCNGNLLPMIDTSPINCGNQKMKLTVVNDKIKLECES